MTPALLKHEVLGVPLSFQALWFGLDFLAFEQPEAMPGSRWRAMLGATWQLAVLDVAAYT